MTEIHDVVGRQLIIARSRQIPGENGIRIRLREERVIRDHCRIRTAGITRPNPHRLMSSFRNVTLDPCAARNFPVSVRAAHTLAGGTKTKSMISALHNVTNQLSSMQWSEPMRATISEG